MSFSDFLRYRLGAGLRNMRGMPVDEWSVRSSPSGFELNHGSYRGFRSKNTSSVVGAWSEVTRVVAYKQDNFTWDTIWLQIELLDGTVAKLPEEAAGWNDLLEDLPRRLPGCPPFEDWWHAVAVPAFSENLVQLYPPPNNSSKPTPLRGAA